MERSRLMNNCTKTQYTRPRGGSAPAKGRANAHKYAAGQEFGPLEFVVFPLELPKDFQGVLGGNFFPEHVVCLDYEKREVRVRQVSRASDSSISQ